MSSQQLSFLVDFLEKAGHEYHNNGTYLPVSSNDLEELSSIVKIPTQFNLLKVVTDPFYDFLEEALRVLDPNHPFLKKVGATVVKQKAKLPIQMSGLDKMTVNDGSVAAFSASTDGEYLVSDKLDGISIQIEYGDVIKAFTRGDGVSGEDISYLIKYLKVPQTSPYKNVRGEIIMRKDTFASKWADEYENARNLVAGKVNSKSIHAAIYDIDIVIYGVLSDSSEHPSVQLKKLSAAGFNVVNWTVLPTIDDASLSDLLKERKEKSPYELDGMVVIIDEPGHSHSVDSPSWGRKFKENVDFHEVEVIGVNYEPSKDGYLKPTLSITPTRMSGVTVTNVTAFNHKFIVDNKIGAGAKLMVTRSGDVIPHIIEVISPSTGPVFEPSEPWVWNASGVDAVVENPDLHPQVKLRRISFFFSTLKIDELGRSSFEKVIAAGYDTVDKIIMMTQADWKTVEGFAGRRGEIAYTEMQKCLQNVYLPSLADATGFFGRGFGTTRFESILAEHPDLMDRNLSRDEAYQVALGTRGIGATTAAQFADGIVKFIPWLKMIGSHLKLVEPEKTEVIGDSFVGQCVTFTGFRNQDWQTIIEQQGGEYVDFGKKTTLLVYGGKKSGKVDAAANRGIKVMSQGEFAVLIEK